MRIYGGSDYAVTSNDGDWTVHVVIGVDPDSRLWLLDLWRAPGSSDAWIEAFCDLVHQWRPIGWAEEQGQIKAGVGPFLERRMRDRSASWPAGPFRPAATKRCVLSHPWSHGARRPALPCIGAVASRV